VRVPAPGIVEGAAWNHQVSVRPLLKWAGGKRQLLPVLRQYYPDSFQRYVEPFFGSGAVFFDLFNAERLAGRAARLVDNNPDLVGCYRTLRDSPDAVIAALEPLAEEHRVRGAAFFYEIRDRRFNPARAAAKGTYTPELAAMLIYLNRTGFNGLFRLNRRGEFNVPAGRYVNPRICDADHLRTVARALAERDVTMEQGSFDRSLADAGPGDFVYCDPPYAPLSRTACFAQYTAGGFTTLDQQRLQQAVVAAAERGAIVVVSNSSAPEIETMYRSDAARRAGLRIRRVEARRAINSRASSRGPVDELIITNARHAALAALPARAHMAKGRLGAREKRA
jgi:DNA adenine methylase